MATLKTHSHVSTIEELEKSMEMGNEKTETPAAPLSTESSDEPSAAVIAVAPIVTQSYEEPDAAVIVSSNDLVVT